VNGHFVHYQDGVNMYVEDFIVDKLVNVENVQYNVKRIDSLIVGPDAMPITKIYLEE
jgi:hypothetical protein